MKIPVKLITLMFLAICSTPSKAICESNSCWDVKIENLYVTAQSNIIVTTSGDESVLPCSGTDGKYVTLNTEHKNSDYIYSTLLAARTADKSVQIVVYPGSEGCIIDRIEYGKYFN